VMFGRLARRAIWRREPISMRGNIPQLFVASGDESGASEAVSVDDGLAALVPGGGTNLPITSSPPIRQEDRRALQTTSSAAISSGIAGGARHHANMIVADIPLMRNTSSIPG